MRKNLPAQNKSAPYAGAKICIRRRKNLHTYVQKSAYAGAKICIQR